MTAPEQDWLERLRAQRPADARGGRGSRLWPLLCDVVEAAELIVPTASHEIVGPYEYVRGDELYAARSALATLKAEVERDE